MDSRIEYTVLGGGCKIGANSYLIKYGDYRILIDAGWNPSSELDKMDAIPDFYRIDKLDAIFISHAHQDHIGSLLIVSEMFPNTPVYVSEETYHQYKNSDILEVMMEDSIRIKKRHKKDNFLADFEHLFFTDDVLANLRKRMVPVKYNVENFMKNNIPIKFIFYLVSHIKGASAIYFEFGKNEKNKITLLYTGDFTMDKQLVHPPTKFPKQKNIDFMVVESTYGQENVFDIEKERKKLIKFIKEHIDYKYVLIPSFALGRTQEVMAAICEAKEDGILPYDLKIYTTGLSGRVTNVYLNKKEANILDMCGINITRELFLNYGRKPKLNPKYFKPGSVIIVGNGMLMPDTPSYIVFKDIMNSKGKNGVMAFVGYLSPDSLGGIIWNNYQKGIYEFSVADSSFDLRNVTMAKFRLAAHVQRKDIKKVVEEMKPGGIIITHGDMESVKRVKKDLVMYDATYACRRESIILGKKQGGMRYMKKTKSIKAHIVSVGTSMLWKEEVKNELDINSIKTEDQKEYAIKFILKQLKKKPGISAEVSGILRAKELNEGDKLFFIATDSISGDICGEVLRRYYADNGYDAELIRIKDLDVNKNFKKGLKNLVMRVLDIIDAYSDKSVLYAIGGYKPQVYYVGMIGQIMNRKVLYSHETQDGVIELPLLPISFDLSNFLKNKSVIDRILSQKITEVETIPDEIKDMFEYNPSEKRYEFTPMGRILYSKFMEEYLVRGVMPKIDIKQENIWGPPKRITKWEEIPDESVRDILTKVAILLPHDISNIKLEEARNKKKSKDTYMEYLKKSGKKKIHYYLHTPKGSFVCTINLNKNNIQDKAIRMIGKKMYL